MAELPIRVPSVDALFDAWSIEPLGRRPLSDEARERILDAWIDERKRDKHATPAVALRLPAAERSDGLDATIAAGVHHDMEAMAVDARRHWIRRSLRPRESRVGIALFFIALLIAGLIDYNGSGDSVFAQVFTVLAWVAIWAPAYRIIVAASFRLARKRFVELADAEVRVSWD